MHLRRSLIAAAIALVLGQQVSAEGTEESSLPKAGQTPSGAQPTDVTDSRADQHVVSIGRGDTLDIHVWADEIGNTLSGQYVVNEAGVVLLPSIGEVTVAGLSTIDAQEQIHRLLTTGMSVGGVVSVSIAQYAPVFVLGEVVHPGPVPYRPSMTVFDLVLLAGGFGQSGGLDLESTRSQLLELDSTRISLLTHRDRLLAETRGEKTFTPTEDAADPDLKTIAENEKATLSADTKKLTVFGDLATKQKNRIDEEIRTLQDRKKLSEQEIEILEDFVGVQSRLAERGILINEKLDQAKLDLIRSRKEALQLETEISRAEQGVFDIDRAQTNMVVAMNLDALQNLESTQLDLNKVEIQIRGLRALLGLNPSASNSATALGRTATYTVYRRNGGSLDAGRTVDEMATVERGDIVSISFRRD